MTIHVLIHGTPEIIERFMATPYHDIAVGAERSWARIFAMFDRQIAANPTGGAHNPETV